MIVRWGQTYACNQLHTHEKSDQSASARRTTRAMLHETDRLEGVEGDTLSFDDI